MMDGFERLKAWIAQPREALPPPDTRIALGVLLVKVAKADNAYLFEELEQIDRILGRLNDIGTLQAAKLRAMCERLEGAVIDAGAYAKVLRHYTAYADRLAMVEALWQVVIADGIQQSQEIVLVTWVQDHLGVSAEDCETARRAALSGH